MVFRLFFFLFFLIAISFLPGCGNEVEISNKAGCDKIKREANTCAVVGLAVYMNCVQDEVNRANAAVNAGTLSAPQTLGCTANFLGFSLFCASRIPPRCVDGDGPVGFFPGDS